MKTAYIVISEQNAGLRLLATAHTKGPTLAKLAEATAARIAIEITNHLTAKKPLRILIQETAPL